MKFLILLSIFNFVYFVNGQDSLSSSSSSSVIPQMMFKTWQFKPDRNIDFGLDLFNSDIYITPEIFKNYLDTISNPSFCCGDSEVVSSNDPNIIVAHGENTVNQWFADAPYGIVDDSQCPSYRVDFPFEYFLECPQCNFGEIISYPFSYSNIGFNNQTLFNYDNDVDQGLFCFETHFSFKFNEPIPARLPVFAYLTVESPGEIWAFVDNELVIDKGGIGFSDTPFGENLILGNDNLNHTANIFGCQRMDKVDHREFSLAIYTNNMGIFCSYVDECGFCEGDSICREQCFDDETSCSQKRTLCGTCVEADRDCDDGDACTLDFCTEGTGCEHSYIIGCRCDESNCNTTDLCFPKQCDENSEHCIMSVVECPPTDDCPNPYCEEGNCLCEIESTTTTTSIITSEATTTSTPTTSTTSTTSLPTTTTSVTTLTTSTTLNPTTMSTISPTTTMSTTTTTMSTTSPSTTSTTFIPTTTTDLTTVSHTTELSTIYSSTIGTTSSTTTTGSTLPPRPMAVCNENIDCPPHYCCYQISKHSYTCISKYFEDQCSPDRLKIF
ncbi:hypothetical protein ACTFIZ_009725 [Dictyostelium cf. discoideum]